MAESGILEVNNDGPSGLDRTPAKSRRMWSRPAAAGELHPARERRDSPLIRQPHPDTVEKLVVTPTAPPNLVEQYRKLAATLHYALAQRGVKVIMVTSAVPGEGKSLTTANLALTLSESYRRRV